MSKKKLIQVYNFTVKTMVPGGKSEENEYPGIVEYSWTNSGNTGFFFMKDMNHSYWLRAENILKISCTMDDLKN